MRTVVEVRNVVKKYTLGDEDFFALKGVSMHINEGEFVSIIGSSGSGKSTLMHILGLLDKPTSGEVFVDGKNTVGLEEAEMARLRNKTIGFVFQSFNLLQKTSALDNVALPLIYSGVRRGDRSQRAQKFLEEVGLGSKLKNTPSQLSGGQQQRVAIARALVNDPSLILADEPTGNLDSKSGEEVLRLFEDLHRKGKTIVIVTHDSEVASRAKRIIRVKDGQVEV